jgi:hypothetical protein
MDKVIVMMSVIPFQNLRFFGKMLAFVTLVLVVLLTLKVCLSNAI